MIDCLCYNLEVMRFIVLVLHVHSGIRIDHVRLCFINRVCKSLLLFRTGVMSAIIFHFQIEFLFFLPLSQWCQIRENLSQSFSGHIFWYI